MVFLQCKRGISTGTHGAHCALVGAVREPRPVARVPACEPRQGDDRLRRAARLLHAVRRWRDLVESGALGAVRPARPAQRASAQARADLQTVPAGLPAHAAADVRYRARSARGRHGVVGRRAVHRRPGLAEAALGQSAGAHRRGAGLHRRPVRRAVPDDRRLRHHAPARRPAARSLGLHQETGLLGDDHPPEVRWARLLRLRALDGRREDREPIEHGRLDGRGAELARSRRAPAALRHRGAEAALPAAACARRGDPVLRAHRPARRLGREHAPGHRRRLPRHVPGARDDRHPPALLEALHHARADRDHHRPRLPPVRSRPAHGRD